MTSKRSSTYSTHSLADAHLLAMLDGKQDIYGVDTQSSRLSVLLPSKLLQTVLAVPGPSAWKHSGDQPGINLSSTSFGDRQKSIQVIGLPVPEKSRSSLKRSPESEHDIDDFAVDSSTRGMEYDSEPQMRYLAPEREAIMYTSGYRQQGCGYRHPAYYGPYSRDSYYGAGMGYGCPQRPPQAYFPGRQQRRYGGGYSYGGGGCGHGRRGYPSYGRYYAQRPVLVRRHGGCCYCC